MDLFLRIATIVIFIAWQTYWWITEKKADQEKPKTPLVTKLSYVKRYGLHYVAYAIIIIQVLGLTILPLDFNLQIFGFFLVIVGVAISVSARITLGTNWAHAAEYQIKKNQTLITNGIYQYIRNPIYTGLLIAVTGAELVARSYLFIVVLCIGFWIAYTQSKREEKILEAHFGSEYRAYRKRSKMLIPFVF